jgi:putative methanogenesis marker protein 8
MCTEDRIVRMKDFLSFGVSETLTTLIEEGEIDSVVSVCEGCGTVIITEPEIVQGTGGRVSGLISTSPLDNIIEEVGRGNVLDPENSSIDQIKGTQKAIDMGYKKIAVTIVSAEDAEKLREIERKNKNIKIYIFASHISQISKKDAETIFNNADVVTGCASKYIKRNRWRKRLFQGRRLHTNIWGNRFWQKISQNEDR